MNTRYELAARAAAEKIHKAQGWKYRAPKEWFDGVTAIILGEWEALAEPETSGCDGCSVCGFCIAKREVPNVTR